MSGSSVFHVKRLSVLLFIGHPNRRRFTRVVRDGHLILQVCGTRNDRGFNNKFCFGVYSTCTRSRQFCWRSHKNLSTEVSRLCRARRIMLTSKINVCSFRETKILNNVGERSSFILVPFVSVDPQTFTFVEMSQVFRCTSKKSSLHDPNCAMNLLVLLWFRPISRASIVADPTLHRCVCSECRKHLPNRENHARNFGSPVANTSSRGPVLNNACASNLCSFNVRFGFGLQPRLHG